MTVATLFNVSEWWGTFDLTVQIFYGIGLVAGGVIVVLVILSLIGLDHDHLSSIGETGGDATDGTTLLSLKPILGFLLGFGWAGGAMRAQGNSIALSCLGAVVAGAVVMACIYVLVRTTSKLSSDGTLKMQNAVGQIGSVYVNIPAHSGMGGQITVNVGDRMIVLQAVHQGPATLTAGTKVKVLEFLGSDTVRVVTIT